MKLITEENINEIKAKLNSGDIVEIVIKDNDKLILDRIIQTHCDSRPIYCYQVVYLEHSLDNNGKDIYNDFGYEYFPLSMEDLAIKCFLIRAYMKDGARKSLCIGYRSPAIINNNQIHASNDSIRSLKDLVVFCNQVIINKITKMMENNGGINSFFKLSRFDQLVIIKAAKKFTALATSSTIISLINVKDMEIVDKLHQYYDARHDYKNAKSSLETAKLAIIRLAVESGMAQQDALKEHAAEGYLDGYLKGKGIMPADTRFSN